MSSSFFAIAAVFLFIGAHSQVKELQDYSIYEIAFFRAFGVLFFSLPAMLALRISPLGKDRKNLVFRGLFGSLALFCYFVTLKKLPLATAVLLQQFAPLFAVFFASFLLKEKTPLRVYLIFCLALFGLFLIKDQQMHSLSNLPYMLLGLAAAALSALAYNFVRKLKESDHPLVVLSYFQFVLVPLSLGGVFLNSNGLSLPATSDYRALLLLSLFSFLAQVCLTLAYHLSKVAKASSFNFLSIPLSLLYGSYYFGEHMSSKQMLGVLFVFLAVLLNSLWSQLMSLGLFSSLRRKQ